MNLFDKIKNGYSRFTYAINYERKAQNWFTAGMIVTSAVVEFALFTAYLHGKFDGAINTFYDHLTSKTDYQKKVEYYEGRFHPMPDTIITYLDAAVGLTDFNKNGLYDYMQVVDVNSRVTVSNMVNDEELAICAYPVSYHRLQKLSSKEFDSELCIYEIKQ